MLKCVDENFLIMPNFTMGKDAIGQCLARYLHPSKDIRDAFPNMEKDQAVKNLIVIHQEMKIINQNEQLCVIVMSPQFKNGDALIELHTVKWWFKVIKEGPSDLFFTAAQLAVAEEPMEGNNPLAEIACCSAVMPLMAEDAKFAWNTVPIDDDNAPAPENIFTGTLDNSIMVNGGIMASAIKKCQMHKQKPNNQLACLIRTDLSEAV
jgi:hypothetical protein